MAPYRSAVAFRTAVFAMLALKFATATATGSVLVAHLAFEGDVSAVLFLVPVAFLFSVAKMALREAVRSMSGAGLL